MKTNASSKTILKAVENVSATKYKGNVVFRKSPFNLTKNVKNFTVRTIDSNGLGAMVNKNGLHLAKANWKVHEDIMNEIFRLELDENIYVDTIYGRQYNKIVHSPAVEKVLEPILMDNVVKRTLSERNEIIKERTLSQFLKTLMYIIKHPELISR